ncbi:hypothetical protein CARUB_v10010966mg [Capsella rubella]|uniref:Plant thionin family protein n=1 Tax=Capsella rubella TaxID=81985 RepID=R0IE05_9BRAS|nr:hypothetical protein CARUB_v10010966mg [Capsella rubella]
MKMKNCIVVMMVLAVAMVTMVEEVEGTACMSRCLFLCGFFFQHPVSCEDKCNRKCHPYDQSQSPSQMETIGMRNIKS